MPPPTVAANGGGGMKGARGIASVSDDGNGSSSSSAKIKAGDSYPRTGPSGSSRAPGWSNQELWHNACHSFTLITIGEPGAWEGVWR